MPIILEVNDYDSENDLSSTEDDNTNLSNIENKRKKNVKKSKKDKKKKKTLLKESKIVKDTAKKKIKNMEKQILKTKYEYSDKKIKKEEIKNEEIREFFTDAELADQFEELRKLEKTQKKLWKHSANSHIAIPETDRRGNLYTSTMPLMISNSSMFQNTIKTQNNSRTKKLNSNSIVNTNMPLLLRGSKLANRGYSNIGKMW